MLFKGMLIKQASPWTRKKGRISEEKERNNALTICAFRILYGVFFV
jgi:hypothetical protein